MFERISRRDLLRQALIASAVIPLLAPVARAAGPSGLTALDPKDVNAKSLGFVTTATDAASNPSYKKGQRCAECVHYQGKPTEAAAGCDIYAGHTVPAAGWCLVWSQRPG